MYEPEKQLVNIIVIIMKNENEKKRRTNLLEFRNAKTKRATQVDRSFYDKSKVF